MSDRPERPPQVISAGEPYAKDVAIFDRGVKSERLFISVDCLAGAGTVYAEPEQLVDGEPLTEVVYGHFEVRWADG